MYYINEKYYYVMQLAGNCAGLGYLGNNRTKGPVDNVVTKGKKCLEALFSNTYFEQVKNGPCITTRKTPQFENDAEYMFEYPFVKILHNNITDPKYLDSLFKRIESFNDFYKKVKTRKEKDHFFTINLNEYDLAYFSKDFKLKGNNFMEMLDYLQEIGICEQCILVLTKLDKSPTIDYVDFANEYIEDDAVAELVNKYHISCFKIINNDVWTTEASSNQFTEQLINLIESRRGIN